MFCFWEKCSGKDDRALVIDFLINIAASAEKKALRVLLYYSEIGWYTTTFVMSHIRLPLWISSSLMEWTRSQIPHETSQWPTRRPDLTPCDFFPVKVMWRTRLFALLFPVVLENWNNVSQLLSLRLIQVCYLAFGWKLITG